MSAARGQTAQRGARPSRLARARASDLRAPACPVVERCGGCPLAHVEPAAQRRLAREDVLASLSAVGVRIDPTSVEDVPVLPETGYRVRARLAWEARGDTAILGYREGHAHTVVAPERCAVLVPALDAARAAITDALAPALAGRGEVHIALSTDPSGAPLGTSLGLNSDDPQPPRLFDTLRALVARGVLAGASVRVGGASVATTFGDPEERSLDVDGRVLRAPIGAFRQSHVRAREALGARVLSLGQPEGRDVLELHAGHGHFSLALAARARSLVANERAAEAARALSANLAVHDLRATVLTEPAHESTARVLREIRAKRRARPSLVVIDPPRAGAIELVRDLAALAPERLVYVSCDPATFARDAARLGAGELALAQLFVLGLFPDTLHVELVGLFERRAPK